MNTKAPEIVIQYVAERGKGTERLLYCDERNKPIVYDAFEDAEDAANELNEDAHYIRAGEYAARHYTAMTLEKAAAHLVTKHDGSDVKIHDDDGDLIADISADEYRAMIAYARLHGSEYYTFTFDATLPDGGEIRVELDFEEWVDYLPLIGGEFEHLPWDCPYYLTRAQSLT